MSVFCSVIMCYLGFPIFIEWVDEAGLHVLWSFIGNFKKIHFDCAHAVIPWFLRYELWNSSVPATNHCTKEFSPWLQQRDAPSVVHSTCHTSCTFSGMMWDKSAPLVLRHTVGWSNYTVALCCFWCWNNAETALLGPCAVLNALNFAASVGCHEMQWVCCSKLYLGW